MLDQPLRRSQRSPRAKPSFVSVSGSFMRNGPSWAHGKKLTWTLNHTHTHTAIHTSQLPQLSKQKSKLHKHRDTQTRENTCTTVRAKYREAEKLNKARSRDSSISTEPRRHKQPSALVETETPTYPHRAMPSPPALCSRDQTQEGGNGSEASTVSQEAWRRDQR